MIKKILLVFVLFLTITIFKNYSVIATNIVLACNLFLHRIFPSLFPMFIISSLLINLNFIQYLNIIFNKLFHKLFALNSHTTYIFLMSIISGFPSNAKIAKEMYEANLIDANDVQKIILFSHFSNPLFIMSMVKEHTLLVLVAHYLGNFIIGFIIRHKYNSLTKDDNIQKSNIKITDALTTAINSAIGTLLFILGTIVTFYIITTIINTPLTNTILELSQGLNYLSSLHINTKLKTILCGSLLSFGGLCIHYQVYGLLDKINIKYLPYLLARISHAVITAIIIFLFYH